MPQFKIKPITSGNVTLQPGRYIGGITITGTAKVTLAAGIYYMDGGGFSVSAQATVTDNGAGVMIYNVGAKNSDAISITGQANVTLTGLKDPLRPEYQGLIFFQARTSSNSISFDGQGKIDLTGWVYGAKALVKVNGQGNKVLRSDTANGISAKIVAFDIMTTGKGVIKVQAPVIMDNCVTTIQGGGIG